MLWSPWLQRENGLAKPWPTPPHPTYSLSLFHYRSQSTLDQIFYCYPKCRQHTGDSSKVASIQERDDLLLSIANSFAA
ncbi:hypothetical protein EVAR_22104_1 [Eumeta japonica]|uniref:Uncharacterized protein n=1 Tax=Eumeta variegata TaxID=151549 RepID=A0A4C1W040_EUMVA|nr:hypothetical protein EVAR_22104_1 [Eumeta japonica]